MGCGNYCGDAGSEPELSFKQDDSRMNFYAVAPNLTETSFETPGSCMVTPYSTGAMLIVFLLCVMSTNWVCMLISFTRSVKRPMLASSSGASTSSRMQNGLGAYWKIPTSNESAVRAFSPPESNSTLCSFLPGGEATTSIPLSEIGRGSCRERV